MPSANLSAAVKYEPVLVSEDWEPASDAREVCERHPRYGWRVYVAVDLVDVTEPVGVVVPELRRDVDHLEMGYWNRDPLRSLGEGEIEQLEAGDVTPPSPVMPLEVTRVGMTTLVGVLGVCARDDPNDVIDAVLEEYADQPPPVADAVLEP